MAKTVIFAGSSGGTSITSGDFRRAVGDGVAIFGNDEALAVLELRRAGTLSKLGLQAAAGSARSLITRISGSDGNQSVGIGTSAGWYEDTSNTDSVSAGALLALRGATADGTYYSSRLVFEAAADTVAIYASGSGSNPSLSNNNATRYLPLAGPVVILSGNEDQVQLKAGVGGTLAYFQVNVGFNARSTNTTFRSRVNGSDGNASVVAPGSTTGVFTDLSNTDTIAAGDLISASLQTGASGGQIYIAGVSGHFINSADEKFDIWSAVRAADSSSGTHYYSLAGSNGGTNQTSEDPLKVRLGFDATVYRLAVYVSGASPGGSRTLTLRVAGSDAALTLTNTSGTAGWYEATGAIDVGADDDITIAAGSGSGNVTIQHIGITVAERSAGPRMGVRVGGAYVEGTPYVRVSGAYVPATGMWIRDGGTYVPAITPAI